MKRSFTSKFKIAASSVSIRWADELRSLSVYWGVYVGRILEVFKGHPTSDALSDLLPFVQFKKCENNHGVTFNKVAAFSCSEQVVCPPIVFHNPV